MFGLQYYESEICVPDSILLSYKEGALCSEQRAEVERHLAECDVCRNRLETIEADVAKMEADYESAKKRTTVPKELSEHILNVQAEHERRNYAAVEPKRGDIYLARGRQYSWQPSKTIVIINYVLDEDVYYVVPLNMIYIYGTDTDVIVKDQQDVFYMAAANYDGNLYRGQLKKKVGEISEDYIEDISSMIMHIAGKDNDISNLATGIPVVHKDDPRIPHIEEEEYIYKQLFAPYREQLDRELN